MNKIAVKTFSFPSLGKIMSIAGLASIPFVIFSTPVFAFSLSFTGGTIEFSDFSTGGALFVKSAINNSGTVVNDIHLSISYLDDDGDVVPTLNRTIDQAFSNVNPGGTYEFPPLPFGTLVYSNGTIPNLALIPNQNNVRLSGYWTYNGTAVPEPLTMLGAATAVGFGTAFKRRLAKVTKENKNS